MDSFEPVFGKPLDKLYMGESGAPVLLEAVFDDIGKNIKTEGIFRKTGNRNTVNELGVLLSMPSCCIPPSASVHDTISFLKKWLLELPEPLISPQLINEYYDKNNPKSISKIIKELPEVNRKSLFLIVSILLLVLNNAEYNKMNMPNLTTCFQTPLFKNNEGLREGIPFSTFLEHCSTIINQETFADFKIDDE